MNKVLLFCVFLIIGCKAKKDSIEGAYELVSAKYGDSILSMDNSTEHRRTIKLIKDGHWMVATFFGYKKITVESASGGSYILKDNNYIETIKFSSEGESEFDKIDTFTYQFDKKNFTQQRVKLNDEGVRQPLKEIYLKLTLDKNLADTSMEGVWKLRESEWSGKKVEDPDFIQYKIYSYPYFTWAQYHEKGKNFIGAGGGTYRYDGKKLVEYVQYLSYYDQEPGNLTADIIRLSPGVIQQISDFGGGKEIWEKIK